MKTVKARDLNARVLREAGGTGEAILITNSGAICAVAHPISADWLHQVVRTHGERIAASIQQGEFELEAGQPLVTLDDALALPAVQSSRRPPRATIRELSARRIAEIGTPFVLCDHHQVVATVVPVPESWLDSLLLRHLMEVIGSGHAPAD